MLATINVNTLVDEINGIGLGGISLREAIGAAAPGDTIDFSVSGTINLTYGELSIDKSVTISGPGANLLTVDASGNDPTPAVNDGNGSRIFRIEDRNNNSSDVEILGLTLTGSDKYSSYFNRGGAITCFENLTVRDCTITGNSNTGYGQGGAILCGGRLEVVNTTISENSASGSGGGIWAFGNDLIIANSTISGNVSGYRGGGIHTYASQNVMINNCTISGNSATGPNGTGGGIWGYQSNITIINSTINNNSAAYVGGISTHDRNLTIINSTVSGNQSVALGGGVDHVARLLIENNVSITNSTISGNSSGGDGGGVSIHRAYYNSPITATIAHCTITDNRADADSSGGGLGGGIATAAPFINVINTIVAGNTRGVSTPDDVNGTVTLSFSLLGVNTGAGITDNGGNLIGTSVSPINPLLGPLADNGGPTWTHALLAGSPAGDAGDPDFDPNTFDPPLIYDQRGAGFGRVVDGDGLGGARIDIGAYESQGVPIGFPAGDYNHNGIADAADYVLWRDTLGQTGLNLPANGDNSGPSVNTIDQADYTFWRAHFGNTAVPTTPGAGAGAEAGAGVTFAAVATDPSYNVDLAGRYEAGPSSSESGSESIALAPADGAPPRSSSIERRNSFVRAPLVVASASDDQLLLALDQAISEFDANSESSDWSLDTNGLRREHESKSSPDISLAVTWIDWD